MGQFLHTSTPEQVRQRVEIPHVELIVQRAAEAHAYEVRCEQNQHYLYSCVKAQHKHDLLPVQQHEHLQPVSKLILNINKKRHFNLIFQ